VLWCSCAGQRKNCACRESAGRRRPRSTNHAMVSKTTFSAGKAWTVRIGMTAARHLLHCHPLVTWGGTPCPFAQLGQHQGFPNQLESSCAGLPARGPAQVSHQLRRGSCRAPCERRACWGLGCDAGCQDDRGDRLGRAKDASHDPRQDGVEIDERSVLDASEGQWFVVVEVIQPCDTRHEASC
jgi:hypothetical protein